MNFILGLIVGAAFMSGDGRISTYQDILGQIPLRCLAALDEGDAAYFVCRRLSMMKQLQTEARVYGPDGYGTCWAIWRARERTDLYEFIIEPSRAGCDVDRALSLELKALRALEATVKAIRPARSTPQQELPGSPK